MFNKKRKLESFIKVEEQSSSLSYDSAHYFEEFVLAKKNTAHFSVPKVFSMDAKEEDSYSSYSSLEYSQDANNYDDYPDLFGETEGIVGNQILDFGLNEIPNTDSQQMIEYECLDFKQFIGQGNFSDVWSARMEGDIDSNTEDESSLVAVKVLKPNKGMNFSLENFMTELQILRRINQDENEYVLKLIGFCKSPQLCIITELMDFSLYDLIHDPHKNSYLDSLQNKIKVALHIARGIHGINEKSNILHNDLTSKNILLREITSKDNHNHTSDHVNIHPHKDTAANMIHITDNTLVPIINNGHHDSKKSDDAVLESSQLDYLVKITDFGLSCYLDNPASFPTKRANARWRSPEQTLSNIFSKKGEVWSFGVIFWEILTKQLPYSSVKESKLVAEKVANKTLSLDIPSSFPLPILDLLADCLVYDHEKRASITNVVSSLESFYFNTFHQKI